MTHAFSKLMQEENKFVVTWELVPGRGAWEESQEQALRLAEQAAKGKIVHAVSLTENPSGHIGISPEGMGKEIQSLGLDCVIHITCKDKNRSQLESQLYALERCELHNLLVLTGDFEQGNQFGRPKPVFDLDSTHLLQMIQRLNDGLEIGKSNLKPCNFFPGAAVSPFKSTEAEQILQYSKLRKKIENGAKFIITQVGFDVRKYHELLLYTKKMNMNIPLIGNIFLLNYFAARAMNQNKIPGCVVTDKLFAQLEEEKSKGISTVLERSAKQYAMLKGMGYKGVHIGGINVQYEQVEYIISKGEELSSNWQNYLPEFDYPQDKGFYFFEKDTKTGLNDENSINKSSDTQNKFDLNYKVSRIFHKLFFVPGKNLFRPMQKICVGLDGSKLEKPFHALEHTAKAMLYNCQDCGDCALTDLAYVCPMGSCPKNQRNGPCEGGSNGWCEVYPGEKQCVWVKAYNRLKQYNEENKLNSYKIEPCNWQLQHTSSWINFYEGKDHSAERLGICQSKKMGKTEK